MTKLIEIISTFPIATFMMVGILIAAVSIIIEENKRRKNK